MGSVKYNGKTVKWLDILIPLESDGLDEVLGVSTSVLIRVDINTGQIDNWCGKGGTVDVHVCDGGTYRLVGEDEEFLAAVADYVPHGVVPGRYGDDIVLEITRKGRIKNWPKKPDLLEFYHD